jgi:uncharacterized protein (TIGR02099 family)
LISVAVGLSGVRLLLWEIEHYKFELATRISELVGTPVSIGYLGAKLRGFNPQLVLKDIALDPKLKSGNEKPAIEVTQIRLGINLLYMMSNPDILSSSWVTVVGAKLTVKRQMDGSIVIVGLKAGEGQPQWLLQGGKFHVLNSEITWQDEKNPARPLLFKQVDLAISNFGERHRLNVLFKLPKNVGNNVRVSTDFEGNIFEPSTIQGRVYIEGNAVNLPELVAGFESFQSATIQSTAGQQGGGAQTNRWLSGAEARDEITVDTGSGDFKIWGDWQQSQWVSVDLAAHIQQLTLVRQDKQTFLAKQLTTRAHWGVTDFTGGVAKHWQLDVNDFSLETQDNPKGVVKQWPSLAISVSGQHSDDSASPKIALFVEKLDLLEASNLARFFGRLSDDQAKILQASELKGSLEELSVFADPNEKTFAVNSNLAKISVSPFDQIPGIDNLTGHIKGTEKSGVLRLAIDDTLITAPDFFREALVIRSLKGAINWRQTDADWTVSSQELELNLHGLQSINRLSLRLPKTKEDPFLDLQSSFVSEDISQAKHYFPTKVMKPADVTWFDAAFLGGRVTKGSLLYFGKLGVFPSKPEEGVFEALLDIDQLNLSYVPDWPQLTNVVGEVSIVQKLMTCEIKQGQSNNLNILQATVINPALGSSKIVTVKGELEGEISEVFSFLRQTPLVSQVGFLVDAVVPQGSTKVALDLTLPLAPGLLPKVYGTALFNQASLNVSALDLEINKINGKLKFTEFGVFSETIHAAALGRPIQVNINRADHQQTFLDITGNVGIEALQQQFKMSGWEIAKGSMAYQLRLGLPYAGRPSELIVKSDLEGIALDLPKFLAKTKNQKKPLSLGFDLGGGDFLPIKINYNDQLKAAVKLNLAQQRLHSGHILIGSGEVEQPSETGLLIEVSQDPLNLQDWMGLSTFQNNKSGNDVVGNNIRQIKVHSQNAQWKKTPLGVFDLSLKPEGKHWTGAISSAFATGKIRIPVAFKGTERIVLDMGFLNLSAFKDSKYEKEASPVSPVVEPELELDPATLPLLSITADKTFWRSVDLGRLTLETEHIPGGLGFKSLALTGSDLKVDLSRGDWTRQPGAAANGKHSKTYIEGRMEVARTGEMLEQLDITKDLTETSAVINYAVNWDAAPYQFSLAALKGRLDFDFNNGRILSIEPGLGRILGILAMAQWIKRAQLDFSDVYKEGLTFNNIKGHFDLLNGVASTHDLIMDAIPAIITINGDTDLERQTVDHIINVTPKSAEAVPIAGTIMGKVVALVGRSLTGKDQEGFFFGSQYLVKGDWKSAEIMPMHKNGGLLQKTWNGITDFPWLRQEEQK